MKLTLEFVVNPIVILVVAVGSALVGFLAFRIKLAKSHAKLRQLENEMMSSHAEILELQKIYVKMEAKLKEQAIPVIPMKLTGKDNSSSKEKASK
jgi:hypothetical protein